MGEKRFPEVAEVPVTLNCGIPAEGYKAIYNPSTEEVFDIVSKHYKIIKHEDVLSNIDEQLDKAYKGQWTRTVKLDQCGAWMRAKYTFPEIKMPISPGSKDVVNPTIDTFNSYNRSVRLMSILGALRLICSNGLIIGTKFAHFKKRHMQDLFLQDLKQALEVGIENMEMQLAEWRGWNQQEITKKEEVDKVVEKLQLNNKETELLKEEEETETKLSIEDWELYLGITSAKQTVMTRWVLYNIVTQFITHRIQSEIRRFQLEERARRVFYLNP